MRFRFKDFCDRLRRASSEFISETGLSSPENDFGYALGAFRQPHGTIIRSRSCHADREPRGPRTCDRALPSYFVTVNRFADVGPITSPRSVWSRTTRVPAAAEPRI